MAETKKELRSAAWFGGNDRDGFIHRSWMRNQGFPSHLFEKPVIGICNTWSELTPCNAHFMTTSVTFSGRVLGSDIRYRRRRGCSSSHDTTLAGTKP